MPKREGTELLEGREGWKDGTAPQVVANGRHEIMAMTGGRRGPAASWEEGSAPTVGTGASQLAACVARTGRSVGTHIDGCVTATAGMRTGETFSLPTRSAAEEWEW